MYRDDEVRGVDEGVDDRCGRELCMRGVDEMCV